jgi:GAF domain-containing protein/HAMP domain-containing protein
MLAFQNVFEELVLLNRVGREQVRVSRLEAVAGNLANRAEAEEFMVPMSSGEVYYGPVRFDEANGEPLMTIAIPLVNLRSGSVQNVLIAETRIKRVWDLIAGLRTSAGQSVFIVDAQDQVVAHRNPSVVLRGTQYHVPDQDGIHSGMAGASAVLVVETIQLGEREFNIVVEQDLLTALSPAITTLATLGAIIIAALLASAFLALLSARQIVQPIESLAGMANRITSGDLSQRAPVSGGDEIGVLAASFNNMTERLQATLAGLERRVAERTSELEGTLQKEASRARQFEAISQVARTAAAIQDLDRLLPRVTQLVSDEFGFYHVGIFLLDEARQFAVLRAANSTGGRRMLERSHRLEVGQIGIVGFVASSGQPRIALDVGDDQVYFNNPDLPETRSELALPLRLRGEIIGVLDVQSTAAGAFTESDVNALSIMADQVAIAIDNARLFGESQRALAEIQSLYSQYLHEEWARFSKKVNRVGYHRSLAEGRELQAPVDSEDIQQVLATGEVVVRNPEDSKSEAAIIVPIKLRTQVIGVLNIKTPLKGRRWSDEEVNMIRVISDRLALALENARLFEETTRTAEREKLVSDITTSIRSTNDPQAMIQMAVAELRRALGVSRVEIIPQRVVSGTPTES